MIGMAVVAVLVCMTLVSCDDDDDYDGPNYNDPDASPYPWDYANIADTAWQIESCDEADFEYGPGDYLEFYSNGAGRFYSGSKETDFTYTEYSAHSISIEFSNDTMSGDWQYTNADEDEVDFYYYWASNEALNFNLHVRYIGDL